MKDEIAAGLYAVLVRQPRVSWRRAPKGVRDRFLRVARAIVCAEYLPDAMTCLAEDLRREKRL